MSEQASRPGTGDQVAEQMTALMEQLARPGQRYRRQTWIAVLALLAFLGLYLGLATWFAWAAYELTIGAGAGRDAIWGWLGGLCAAFLALLMFRALFFVRRGDTDQMLELRAEEQPELFEFLYRLADQAGAPRPHKVFLSAEVNAAVFYDLRLLNLILPSRKNLVIGLGLVQALNLGEFRAVLAHEFGHFGQRAMAVGRWVYVAQQIARHLVMHRGALDQMLQALSQMDFRLAWVGWALRLIVWSIRCVVETAYRAVDLLQRALSREMEMNADLVAVALTGSDALIHALYRLQAADDAWSRAMSFARAEQQAGRRITDLFAIQDRIQQQLSKLLQETGHGHPPPLPDDGAQHRIFRPQMAQPPRMWQTHPANHEREANAKRRYLRAPIDERPAWQLFRDEERLRSRLTVLALGMGCTDDPGAEVSLQRIQDQFEREHLDPGYRGIYFGRSPVRHTADPAELWCALPEPNSDSLADLYPAELSQDMALLRQLETELAQLIALQQGQLEAHEGKVRFRERVLSRKQLHMAVEQVRSELSELRDKLRRQDLRVRSLHLAVAERLGQGWPEHLRGLIRALHYSSHAEANLRDLLGLLQHAVHQAEATGRLYDAGRRRIIDAANALQEAMRRLDQEADRIQLDAVLGESLKSTSWRQTIGTLKLPPATAENLGSWLGAVDSWVDQQLEACGGLRMAALQALLLTEKKLAGQWLAGINPGAAPGASQWPRPPDLLMEGQERPRDHRQSLWVRFQTADGWLPASARLLVAGGIVASVLGLGGQAQQASVSLYNGLSRQVVVTLPDGASVELGPAQHRVVKAPAHRGFHLEVRTSDQALIERFDAPVQGAFEHHVYNIAAAASLVELTVFYGRTGEPPPMQRLGNPRWLSSDAAHVFEEPPKSIRTRIGGESRRVLTAIPPRMVQAELDTLPADAAPSPLVQTHARWDAADSAGLLGWWELLGKGVAARDILAQRLKDEPAELMWRRLQMDMAVPAEREALCQQLAQKARQSSADADTRYLALRCLPDGEDQSRGYIDAAEAHPRHLWLAFAAGESHAEQSQWEQAQARWDFVSQRHPGLAEQVNLNLARLLRWQEPGTSATRRQRLQLLSQSSEALRLHLGLEEGSEDAGAWALAYSALALGRLDQALQQATTAKDQTNPRLLRLIAASDGADGQWVQRALKLPPEQGVDLSTYWPSLALALRERQGQQDLLRLLPAYSAETAGAHARQLQRFVEALAQRRPAAECEALTQGLPLALRAHAMSMGAIVFGAKAPRAWRDGAQRLLFADERPFFKQS